MAQPIPSTSITIPPMKEQDFQSFYQEVKKIEQEDSVLTSKQQIDRMLRPGSTYFNLNPFDVLNIDPDLPEGEIKKKYRRLSILVHPDKNQDDAERAQQAFDAVNKAYKMLTDEDGFKRCKQIIDDSKEFVEHTLNERRKQLKKEGKDGVLPEDTDPERMKRAIYVQSTKMFADIERKRREQIIKNAEERKRQREDELAEAERIVMKKEWEKNFEESRNERVASWNNFRSDGGKKRKKKGLALFRPPKNKPEQRT